MVRRIEALFKDVGHRFGHSVVAKAVRLIRQIDAERSTRSLLDSSSAMALCRQCARKSHPKSASLGSFFLALVLAQLPNLLRTSGRRRLLDSPLVLIESQPEREHFGNSRATVGANHREGRLSDPSWTEDEQCFFFVCLQIIDEPILSGSDLIEPYYVMRSVDAQNDREVFHRKGKPK